MGKRKGGGTRKSLKKPKLYDQLRAKGYSKEKAARISNAVANHTIDHHHGGKSGRKLGRKKR